MYGGAPTPPALVDALTRHPRARRALVEVLASRHGKVMRLVVGAADQQPDEAKATDADELPRLDRRHREHNAFLQHLGAGAPGRQLVKLTGVRRDHAPAGVERPAGTGHRDLDPTIDGAFRGKRPQRDLIHVDEVLAQCSEGHLRPIGCGVGLQNTGDLLDLAEGVPARQRGTTVGTGAS
jgi:hypothetical protein